MPQRLAFDELADDERPAVELAEIVDDENVRMAERRGRVRFCTEAAHPIGIGGHLARQQLERDVAIELRVVGFVDCTHASFTHTRYDAIRAHGAADQVVRRALHQRDRFAFQKHAGAVARCQQRFDMFLEAGVAVARLRQKGGSRMLVEHNGAVEDRFDAHPVDDPAAHGPPSSR